MIIIAGIKTIYFRKPSFFHPPYTHRLARAPAGKLGRVAIPYSYADTAFSLSFSPSSMIAGGDSALMTLTSLRSAKYNERGLRARKNASAAVVSKRRGYECVLYRAMVYYV